MRTFYGLLIFLFLVPVIASASEVTKEAQILLNQLGYKAGAADGIWGSKTKSAIKKFYLNQGSKFDGVLDQNELLDLENAARNDGDLSARSFKDQRSEITSIEDYKSVAPSIAMNYLTEGLNPIWDL